MKVLLTGANGYIGRRLLLRLLEQNHSVICLVRSAKRIHIPDHFINSVQLLEADLLNPKSLEKIPNDLDAAYYLVHSMSTSAGKFSELEAESATNFKDCLSKTKTKQIIYLSGLVNEKNLSKHLSSRKNVEIILRQGRVPVTTLMAGIIIGSGSASFEIIRDLVEKLPVMIAPKWTKNLTQPIAIRDVLDYLILVLGHDKCIDQRFEIGGPDVMSYKELLLKFAEIRELKRWIITVPVLTPKLSSYWLYFITSASFFLAQSLVESLKNNAICKENEIQKIFPEKTTFNFETSVRRAFERLEQDRVPSSWKDAVGGSPLGADFTIYLKVPEHGVFVDVQKISFKQSENVIEDRIWSLGGETGWLYWNWAWHLRGFIDKIFGGTGLRRGRTSPHLLKEGDALDFWRVLVADRTRHRLLLYAEMKLPGEAWLELKLERQTLIQTATFRPQGVWGRLYWYLLLPFHNFIFRGLAKAICK